ncbi:MAG: Gfo/Idh/MocA family oxidoreductase [Kiritimatiellae bacterium]|nr:Gfo/Idh/MocA family oxidoreductase [Kiritimatiellia bacterium]
MASIAAGVRGSHLAAQLGAGPHSARIVAVAEPRADRREAFAARHGIPVAARFESWEDLCARGPEFDAAIIATMDNQHTGPVLACLGLGRHVLVEKPLADTMDGARRIVREQRQSGRIVAVCHTLRHMSAFRKVQDIVAGGALGRVIHAEHMEAIGHLRFTHNYVRGRWAREAGNTSLLLHKCSHDIDFLAWLIGAPCLRVSSFGCLAHFKPECAPPGAALRCLDGCRRLDTCPYSAVRLYVDNDLTGRLEDLGGARTREERREAVRQGPFGVCVWHAGNDVVDHQIVSMKFDGGIIATCAMTGYSASHGRRTRLQGDEGELLFDEAAETITIRRFSSGDAEVIHAPRPGAYHPEDRGIVAEWLSAIRDASRGVTVDAGEAARTLALVLAAEQSRRENRTVEMSEVDFNGPPVKDGA